MIRFKRFAFFSLSICLIFLSGCYNSKKSIDTEDRKNIDFIVKTRSGDYWNTIQMGANEAAKEFNVNLNFAAPDTEDEIEQQINLVDEAISKKTQAIILAASDYDALCPVVEKAHKNNIPIIIVDSSVNTNKITSMIATNNVAAGSTAAQSLINLTGKNSRIAILGFVKGARSGEEREEGVLDIIKKYPGITVAAKEYSLSDVKLAEELTKKIIYENKNINGIIALNAMSTIGAASAIDDLGLAGKVKLVGFDSTEEEIRYIEHGVIQSTIIQNPFSMAYLGVEYASMAARGQTVPKNVDLGYIEINKFNMYSKENEKLVFPFIK
jgi:ribose transport system substrate-binding protein